MPAGRVTDSPSRPRVPGPTALLLLVLVAAIAVWRWFAAGAPSGGDGFQYLSHALAILEGRPYEAIGYLYTPHAWAVGPPVYPPGLPLTLAPLIAVFGPSSQAPRLLMVGFLLAFVVLAGRYFHREGPREVAWGAAAMIGAGFLLADRSNVIGSDLGFCALVWGVLVLADADAPWGVRRTTVITLLGVGALLFRIAAAPLVAAGALFALVHKASRRGAGIAALIWLGTLLFVVLRFGPGADPARTMIGGDSGGGERGLGSMIGWIVERLDSRFVRYRFGVTEALLYPFPSNLANDIYHVLALFVACVGLWLWVRHRPFAFSTVFALATVAMLAVVPVWQPRYLWVLTPFVAYGFLSGLDHLWSRVAARRSDAVPNGRGGASAAQRIALGLIVLAVVTAVSSPREVLPSERGSWEAVSETLRALPRAPAQVASNRPRKVTWHTGIPAMSIVRRDLTVFLEEAQRLGVSHVVLTATSGTDAVREQFEVWARDHPTLFRPVAETGPVQIFEIDPSQEP